VVLLPTVMILLGERNWRRRDRGRMAPGATLHPETGGPVPIEAGRMR
jgi:hypothetical protein